MTGGTRKNGFTIVEVILVLAIAGLIFMMVFMAVPSLRRTVGRCRVTGMKFLVMII